MSYNPGPMIPYGHQPIIIQDTRKTSGMAVASMILGILGLLAGCCTFGVFSILAVVLGHLGYNETKNDTVKGKGMAIAGLVMGYVFVLPMAAMSVWVLLLGGIGTVTDNGSTY